MSTPPRTLQIVGDSAYGGGGYVLVEWCRFLLERGWRVDVLASHPDVLRTLEPLGVGLLQDLLIPRDIDVRRHLVALIRLVSLLRRRSYQVVHTYCATPGFLGRVAARLAGTPVILHHQAGWPMNDSPGLAGRLLYQPLEGLAVLASSRSICVSRSTRDEGLGFRLIPNSRLVVIRNGIDARPFEQATHGLDRGQARRALGLESEALLIGNTGRLARQKDNETLIRAMALLVASQPRLPACLALAGEGPEREHLERLAASLGLADRVRFLGFVEDVPRLLSALDLFASPSLWEGLSISLLEAMASGLPIVASGIGPNRELIEHGVHGLLVPPRSPAQMAEALVRLATDVELARRCAANARRRALDDHGLDRMLQETLDLYLELLGRGSN